MSQEELNRRPEKITVKAEIGSLHIFCPESFSKYIIPEYLKKEVNYLENNLSGRKYIQMYVSDDLSEEQENEIDFFTDFFEDIVFDFIYEKNKRLVQVIYLEKNNTNVYIFQ